MKKIKLDNIANDLSNTINQIRIIKIQLVRYANDPDKIRTLARQLDDLL